MLAKTVNLLFEHPV